MKVDAIRCGLVIDHIKAGCAMRIYELLGLASANVPVAIMQNVVSGKMGKKDIIKIDADIPVNIDVIGFVDPGATVNIIRDGIIVEKLKLQLPNELKNVIKCKNPRCISSCEQELDQIFRLTDADNKEYRCIWCETKAEL